MKNGQTGGASRWRVCYQRGLPRLVYYCFQLIYLIKSDIVPQNMPLYISKKPILSFDKKRLGRQQIIKGLNKKQKQILTNVT